MIGIAVGSQNSSIGVLKNANVDIILSETSNRSIPTLISFNDKERVTGDGANNNKKSNYKRTVIFPNRWLGLVSGPILEQEKNTPIANLLQMIIIEHALTSTSKIKTKE